MLRPATPLTVVLLISFVLLLLSTLSSPVIPSIPIATFQGIHFGVFGYCTPDGGCTGIRIGYTTDNLFNGETNPDFNLPSQARRSLSSLLIVHPIAALLNLIVLALAAAAHLHSPSHSARYLLGVLILLLPTLLVTLLAFLVDILLFVPHLKWGGWIVLGSTVLITAAGVITCAMRRTLVSRKARKRRIAENAEMSGENFYNRQAAQDAKLATATVPTFSTVSEPKPPMVNGAPGGDHLPSFATFDSSVRRPEDEREPLTQGPPSIARSRSRDDQSARYYGLPPSRSNSVPRDQYGNPLPPRGAPGTIPPLPGHENRGPPPPGPGPYRDGMPPPRGGYGPRGRGGYPPRGRGGPRGPPQGYRGRAGYMGPGRGGYPPPGPPRGPDGAPMAGAVAGAAAGAMMARRPPPPGYGPGPDGEQMPGSFPPPGRDGGMSPSIYSAPDPDGYEGFGRRSQSPGQRRPSNGSRGPSPAGGVRPPSPPPAMPALPPGQAAEMDGQNIQQGSYIPVRAGWNNPAAELPGSSTNIGSHGGQGPRERVNSGGSDVYFEDVDPRFAQSEPMPPPPNRSDGLPLALSAGPPPPPPLPQQQQQQQHTYHDDGPESLKIRPPPLTASYEDLPGARSPAESETSNFTSVSQRGVNPNWRPGGYPGDFNGAGPGPMRRQSSTHARRDVLLDDNPDFQLPGMAPTGRRPLRGRGGYGPNMGGRMPPPNMPPAVDGPYPRGMPAIPDGGAREI